MSGNSVVQSLLRAAGLGILAMQAYPSLVLAQTDRFADCLSEGKPTVVIGLPERYRTIVQPSRSDSKVNPRSSVSGSAYCEVFAFGNDYQVLDWLENGRLDAAVMSEFGAELLQKGQPGDEPFSSLYGVSQRWPLSRGELRTYEFRLRGVEDRFDAEPTTAEFDQWLQKLEHEPAPPENTLLVESHVSSAIPVLIDHVIDAATRLGIDLAAEDALFWDHLFQSLVFGIVPANEGQPVSEFAIDTSSAEDGFRLGDSLFTYQDVFVYDRRLARELFSRAPVNLLTVFPDSVIDRWLVSGGKYDPRFAGVVRFLDSNYSVVERGARRERRFKFSVDEVLRIASGEEAQNASLVLTGGGVKAAYQTRLIDYLYGERLLGHADAPSQLRIDSVIGTSGGALLGSFVSTVSNAEGLNLTERLWWLPSDGRYVESYDLFNPIEMPRYLSLVVAAILLMLSAFIMHSLLRVSSLRQLPPVDKEFLEPRNHAPHASPWYAWVAILLVAPWVIRAVSSDDALEHIPTIAGLSYFFCVLMAAYSNNRLLVSKKFRFGAVRVGELGWRLIGLLVGLVLIIISVILSSGEPPKTFETRLGYVELPTLVCCFGLIIFSWVFHRSLVAQRSTIVELPRRFITSSILILISVPILLHAVLYAAGKTLFELTGEFWRWYSLAAVIVSFAILWLTSAGVAGSWLRAGAAFLLTEPESRPYLLRTRRLSRFAFFVTGAFLWWNLVNAPAIYGNNDSKEFFRAVYRSELCLQRGIPEQECSEVDLQAMLAMEPVIPFVISAASLEQQRERYFVLESFAFAEDCEPGERVFEETTTLFKLHRTDPRWQSLSCRPTAESVIEKAFASGSPFPVFPATNVEVPDTGGTEWLVDGGYAHNVPLEAAAALGADLILVISSSPLHTADNAPRDVDGVLGNLARNLTRLFPYLFERSQIEDVLRSEELLVVSLAPTGDDGLGAWPTLTDFRESTIRRMIAAAEQDINRRIGMFESWGQPTCELGDVVVSCEAVSAARTRP